MASRDLNAPNILFILSDDQGAWAMGCAGNEEIVTPNLDRLASTGIRFESFFCASPVCSPARASILTGMIPSQHGVQDFLRKGNSTFLPADGEEIDYLEGRRAYTDVLSEAGYACGLSGKWHLGHSALPQMGFSYWNVHASGGSNYYNAPMIVDGEFSQPEGYVSDVITDNALDFLTDQLDSAAPFSLNVHYTAPHAPWNRENHPTELFDDYYENCAFDSTPVENIHPNQLQKDLQAATVGDNEETRRSALSGYYAAVTAMDTNIGRLLDWLETNGLRENTLVVFTADNGMNMGHHGIWGKGNGTYPPNMFDTAVKVPTLVSRPGHVPQDLVCAKLLSQYDFMPTLLGYVGIEDSSADALPGRDFSPILRGHSLGDSSPVFVLDEYGPTRMIRTDRWKYVHRYSDGSHELFDLANDPAEAHNLVDESRFAEKIVELKQELENWFDRYADPHIDGSKQNVMGRGQLGLVGSESYPRPFADDVVFYSDRG